MCKITAIIPVSSKTHKSNEKSASHPFGGLLCWTPFDSAQGDITFIFLLFTWLFSKEPDRNHFFPKDDNL